MNIYKSILEESAEKVLGDKKFINVEITTNRIHINGYFTGGSKYSIHTIFTEDDHFVLDKCQFKSTDFFKEYAMQIMEVHVKPHILEMYKAGHTKKLPPNMTFDEKVGLDNVTAEWFKEEFDRLAEEYCNSDKARNVKVHKKEGKLIIMFDMNCGRSGIWEDNTVVVNDKGVVKVHVDDTPIEGGDLESQIKRSVEAKVKC